MLPTYMHSYNEKYLLLNETTIDYMNSFTFSIKQLLSDLLLYLWKVLEVWFNVHYPNWMHKSNAIVSIECRVPSLGKH